MQNDRFPIHEVLPSLRQTLSRGTRLVLEAPPGAGKTTQVPLALLDEPWLAGQRLLMLEPRRVAARAAASFMARQLGEEIGQTVGYRIRFENRVSARTRIEVVTEGILTRLLQDDPGLTGVGAILFDEFHERHLASDLGLALALDVQAGLRDELRLLVMSATLDGQRLADFLAAPRLVAEGRSYPVTISHFPARPQEAPLQQCRRCIEHALATHPGDILVFLAGQRDIGQLEKLLGGLLTAQIALISLHGEMPIEQQASALASDPQGRRRIVLATNLAESSVTLPGVRVVIDAGLAREPRFDPNSGFSRLETVRISRASADQRAGRAGRVAAGWCYRLWPAAEFLSPSRSPEIQHADLCGLALELAAWGSSSLRFLDPPPAGSLAAANDLLRRLGALDDRLHITSMGRQMLTLGTHPRLAAMMLSAGPEERAMACDLAALLEARDPLTGPGGDRGDDWQSRWEALRAFRSATSPTTRYSKVPGVSSRALAAIDHAAGQWRRRLRVSAPPPAEASAHALGDILLHAYPDRIGRQQGGNPLRYLLSNGRGARLREDSTLCGLPWLVATELHYERQDSLVLRGAALDETRLRQEFPHRFTEADVVRWDDSSRALVARRESHFDQILLDSRPAGRPDPAQAAAALCEAVAGYGLASLPWTENLRQWQARVLLLAQAMSELGLPDVSDQALLMNRQGWLLPALQGKFRLDALSARELQSALYALLDWNQQQAVERLAPTRLRVPSGLERPVYYESGSAPVLAVKLQELFGLADTPVVVEGRVPVTLHLLSPGGKLLQITSDLRSFWNATYPEVRKEMKGRYPRHPWPEDPWSATATHRAKSRGS
jgi:ATP-dependent helicase HrpB